METHSMLAEHAIPESAARLFLGDSEMAARMRAFDWSGSTLGPPERWPQSLRSAIGVCLACRFPSLIGWGREQVVLYNDASISLLGETRHARCLGRPGREGPNGLWELIGSSFEGVRTSGRASAIEDRPLTIARRLAREETFFSFSLAPILSRSCKTVEGVFCIGAETTERILADRRLETLRKLRTRAVDIRSLAAVSERIASILAENPRDVPFAALYGVDETRSRLSLRASTGLSADHPLPRSVSLSGSPSPWPLVSVLRSRRRAEVPDLAGLGMVLPSGVWPEPTNRAFVLPLPGNVPELPIGLLVIGLGPRCVPDARYLAFIDLVAGEIGAALAESQALEAERMRVAAQSELERAKAAFFSNISHEVRTPLSLILGPTEAALSSPEKALRGPELEVVYRNELRLLKLVNSLLDLSQIENGRLEMRFEPTNLVAVTAEIAGVFRPSIERAGLKLTVTCEPGREPVYVDRDKWEKIVLNLLSNALKFTTRGEIEVTVRYVQDRALLTVRDTGAGIALEQLPRLFERFPCIEGRSGRTQEGAGIGLALVAEFVRLHGGEVHVASEVGKGSAFTISLRLGSAHLPKEQLGAARWENTASKQAAAFVAETSAWSGSLSERARSSLSADPAQGAEPADSDGRPRILLAADNADLRHYMARLLRKHWSIRDVEDGAAALATAKEERYDLVVADARLPQLDGPGLLRALRADPRLRDLPVILLSARAGEDARSQDGQTAADDFLSKPFTAQELVGRVRSHLDHARLRRAAAAEAHKSAARLVLELEAMSRLHALCNRLLCAKELQPALETVLESAISAGQADLGTIRLFEARRGILELAAQRGFDPERTEPLGPIPLDDGSACARAFRSGAQIFVDDASLAVSGTPHDAITAAAGIRAVLAVPLKGRQGSVLGVLSACFKEARQPSERDRRLLDLYARHAADFVERLSAEEALQRQSSRLRLLWEATSVLLTTQEPGEMLRELFGKIALPLGLDTYLNFMVNESGDALRLEMYMGISEEQAHAIDLLTLGQSLCGEVAQKGRAVVATRIQQSDDPSVQLAKSLGVQACLCSPLLVKDRLIGTLLFGSRTRDHFEEQDLEILATLCRYVTVAEERIRLVKGLQSADRQKNEFLAMLAHELRNPLTPIQIAVPLLRGASAGAESAHPLCDMIERQVQQLARLVEDLLDVGRISQGKIALRSEPLDLIAVLKQAVETVKPGLDARGHTLSVSMPTEEVRLLGDVGRLAQVFANLLHNAVKYTPPSGHIELEVQRQRTAVEVSVRDNGIGIAPEMLPKVFDLFAQAERSLDRAEGGLGIGLSLVSQLVALHGGTVRAQSPGVGKGSTFIVRLPILSGVPSARSAPGIPGQPEPGETLRVLVVDDNETIAQTLALALRAWGYEVRLAADGPSALVVAGCHRPHVVLLDLGLPGMSGHQVAERLRALPETAGCILIAMTGYGQDQERQRSIQAGCNGHLIKPLNLAALRDLLATVSPSHEAGADTTTGTVPPSSKPAAAGRG